jgi:hypothetical protein
MLTRDHGCLRALSWNAALPSGADIKTMAARLVASGFVPARALGAFVLLRDRRANEVALVMSTGRAQIRVSYLVPEAERRREAELVYARLLRAVGVGVPPPAGHSEPAP